LLLEEIKTIKDNSIKFLPWQVDEETAVTEASALHTEIVLYKSVNTVTCKPNVKRKIFNNTQGLFPQKFKM